MKKILNVTVLGVFALGLAACGSGSSPHSAATTTTTTPAPPPSAAPQPGFLNPATLAADIQDKVNARYKQSNPTYSLGGLVCVPVGPTNPLAFSSRVPQSTLRIGL